MGYSPYQRITDSRLLCPDDIVLCELTHGEPTFLERCSQHTHGRTPRFVVCTPEKCYQWLHNDLKRIKWVNP
jgi:hypothetical protein